MPVLRFLVGNPASGKSRLRGAVYYDVNYNGDKHLHVHDVNLYKDYSKLSDGYDLDALHKTATIEAQNETKKAITADKDILVESTYVGFQKRIDSGILQAFHNRGYTIEVFYIMPNMDEDLLRNSLRKYPAPEYLFVSTPELVGDFKDLIHYEQFVDVEEAIKAESLYYEDIPYWKYAIHGYAINSYIPADTTKDLHIDTNAIHFCKDLLACEAYSKDKKYLHKVSPATKVKRKGKIFYAHKVKVLDRLAL